MLLEPSPDSGVTASCAAHALISLQMAITAMPEEGLEPPTRGL
jgi:hypothetical protein